MKSRNFRTLGVIAALLLLITTSTVASTINPVHLFAYEKSETASQASECGDDFMPTNIGCQNTDSEIQGDENAATQTAQQTFPQVEKEARQLLPPPPPPPTEPPSGQELEVRKVDGDPVRVQGRSVGLALAACAPEEVPTGGGLEVSASLNEAKFLALNTGQIQDNGWVASYFNAEDRVAIIQAHATCAKLVGDNVPPFEQELEVRTVDGDPVRLSGVGAIPVFAECGPDEVPTGGGLEVSSASPNEVKFFQLDTGRINPPTGWVAIYVSMSTDNDVILQAHATCAKLVGDIVPPFEQELQTRFVRGGSVQVPGGTIDLAFAQCAPDEVPTGGGVLVGSQGFTDRVKFLALNTGQIQDNGWVASYFNADETSFGGARMQAFVECAKLVDIE
jgi:hypothetical protein